MYGILIFILNTIYFFVFQKAALNVAVESQDIEIVQLLLSISNIDVNITDIFHMHILIKLKIIYFNIIPSPII